MGHSKTSTTLTVYTHLFDVDDHSAAMAALDAMAMAASEVHASNVIQIRG